MSEKKRIRVRWSKKECDLVVAFDAFPNSKSDAGMVLGHLDRVIGLFGAPFREELERRGFDVSTLRFSIELKPEELIRRRGGA